MPQSLPRGSGSEEMEKRGGAWSSAPGKGRWHPPQSGRETAAFHYPGEREKKMLGVRRTRLNSQDLLFRSSIYNIHHHVDGPTQNLSADNISF